MEDSKTFDKTIADQRQSFLLALGRIVRYSTHSYGLQRTSRPAQAKTAHLIFPAIDAAPENNGTKHRIAKNQIAGVVAFSFIQINR